MKRSIFVLIFLFVLSALGANGQTREDFPFVTAPYYLNDDRAVAEWLALHFWDEYDFAAAGSRYSAEQNREGFVEFIRTLYATSETHAAKAINQMMGRAAVSEDSYWLFLEIAEEVLYDPQSPVRNDLLWEHFVRHAVGVQSPLDDVSRGRYRTLLAIVSRNQQGAVATDFTYTLADGSQGRMHKIASPYTVLWFYNPGCGECARTKDEILATGYLEMLHSAGAMEVLAVYPDGDVSAWRSSLDENPEWWITAYDKGEVINRESLYDLKAIPTLYLLDGQKRVILKDPTIGQFVGLLERIYYGR